MRVGIIGAGSMGTHHARAWAETDAEMVGVADIIPERADTLAAKYGWQAFDSMDAILPEVDVVFICTPTDTHHDLVMQAAAAGKHIFCEKPIALSIDDGKAMIAACEAAGVRLFIGMVIHFFPEFEAARKTIADGEIGKPCMIRMTRAGFRPSRGWFTEPERSGGMIVDLMLHDLEYVRWLAGGDEVVRVFAKSVTKAHPEIREDHGLAVLRFRNGAIAHVEGSWAYPPPAFVTKVEVSGEQGIVEFDNRRTQPIHVSLYQEEGETPAVALSSSPLDDDPWAREVKHFWDALKHDKPFYVTAKDALIGLQNALAVRESAQTGKPVTLETVEV
jgi:predicted dehydrogenase